jgi:hypothetical protein
MTDDRLRLVQALVKLIPDLTFGQLYWINKVAKVFASEHKYSLNKSDIFDESALRDFGDAMRVHHGFSAEPFSKDKFEYVFVTTLKISGRTANLAPRGNPGHDATVDGVKISLKTQADKGIDEHHLWISKFMELGKGQWANNPSDLEGLRQQFFAHMKSYDRIFSLRALNKGPVWKYELVEIPKEILALAGSGRLEMKINSKQTPKPGYCYVHAQDGRKIFDLYFDGGGERKLQIKNLSKDHCRVHAVWEFFIPQD